jgi:hypothetical protein
MKFWSGNDMDSLHLFFICMSFLLLKSMGVHKNRYAFMHAAHTSTQTSRNICMDLDRKFMRIGICFY